MTDQTSHFKYIPLELFEPKLPETIAFLNAITLPGYALAIKFKLCENYSAGTQEIFLINDHIFRTILFRKVMCE